jgi:hypothetical protein
MLRLQGEGVKRETKAAEAVASYGERTGTETPTDRLRNAVVVLCVLVALAGLVSMLLYFAIQDVQTFQEEGRIRGFESRAVACSTLAQNGQELPPPCLIPEVTKHYDTTP